MPGLSLNASLMSEWSQQSANASAARTAPAGVEPMPTGRVFVVIPVYNRVELTLKCIALLKAQTYPDVVIVVADGGSTDATVPRLRETCPDVVLLGDGRELWWTGAMALGIDYVLATADRSRDFLLMLNNDTEFDPGFVETLVRVSRQRDAAVGALTVDASDPSRVLDAGEYVDWERHAFPVKTVLEPGDAYRADVDVLPGRGTLVPVRMVAAAGNVEATRLPHYIADYEYFSRLKRMGFALGVTYETSIRCHTEVSGLALASSQTLGPVHLLRILFSRRSMDNLVDHYRFIELATPASLKTRAKLRLLLRTARLVLRAFGLEPLVRVVLRSASSIAFVCSPPWYCTEAQIHQCGLDPKLLVDGRAAYPLERPGETVFVFRRRIVVGRRLEASVARLLARAVEERQRCRPTWVVARRSGRRPQGNGQRV
jgi:GT2 family glycosyltransferase